MPQIKAETQPAITAEEARAKAVRAVSGSTQSEAAALEVSEPELWYYNPALVEDREGPTVLTWRMEVTSAQDVRIDYLLLIMRSTARWC